MDIAQKTLDIARGGLERRGRDEASFLKELERIVESGMSPADTLLDRYMSNQRSVLFASMLFQIPQRMESVH